MVKKLPQVKKGLKEFILDEDAKVIDKTASKIAITTAFFGASFLVNVEDVSAYGSDHSDHNDHQNNVNAPSNYGTGIHAGTNPLKADHNAIPGKAVETYHSNHYNHQDQEGGNGFLAFIDAITFEIFDLVKDSEEESVETGAGPIMPESVLRSLEEEENN